MKEKIIPKTDIKGNIIYGSINDYKISGIVYRDGQLIISIQVNQEVSQELIDRVEYPKFIKSSRYQNGRIDLLSTVKNFNVFKGEEVLEQLINILIEEGITSNKEYQEERIEPIKYLYLKVAVLFIVNMIIAISLALFAFDFQLGQILKSADGSMYVNYTVSIIFGLLPFILYGFNYQYLKIANIYSKFDIQALLKSETINIVLVSIVSVLIHIMYIEYNAVMLLQEHPSYYSFTFFDSLNYFLTVDEYVSDIFIFNIVTGAFALLVLMINSLAKIWKLKKRQKGIEE